MAVQIPVGHNSSDDRQHADNEWIDLQPRISGNLRAWISMTSKALLHCEEYTLASPGVLTQGFMGSFSLGPNGGIGSGNAGTTATIGINNSNIAGVTGTTGSTAASLAVTTGLEIAIPLADLGGSTGPFEVRAAIHGGGDSFLSNQFLPGLPPGTGNLGNGGKFDFSSTPGEFLPVPAAVVPEPTTLGLLAIAAVPMLAASSPGVSDAGAWNEVIKNRARGWRAFPGSGFVCSRCVSFDGVTNRTELFKRLTLKSPESQKARVGDDRGGCPRGIPSSVRDGCVGPGDFAMV